VYLTGDFAKGMDSQVIDLILVGSGIDREYLARKVVQAEEMVGRKVSYIILDPAEADAFLGGTTESDLLPLWNIDGEKIKDKSRSEAETHSEAWGKKIKVGDLPG
jgi:hypothetical protein